MSWSRSYKIIKECKVEGIVIYSKIDYTAYTAEIILKNLHYKSDVKSDLISDGKLMQAKDLKLLRIQTENTIKELFGDSVVIDAV